MDAWNIYHKDGSVLCDVDGNQVMFTSLENTDVWMGECSVSITVKNNSPIIFSIGDYVIYRNDRYEINYDPGKIKASSKNTYGEGFVYNDIKFNSLSDELVRAEFLDVVLFEGTVNVDGIETPLHYTALPKFSFYVEFIDDLLDRIQANMNEQYGDGVWKIFSTNMERSVVRGCSESDWHNAYGDESKYIEIDSQSITVDNSTCWDALSLVNSKWDITFIVRGRNVYVGINGPNAPHVFKYGKGNGLREIEQTVDSDQNVITRLRAYGSDKNMPQRYYAELGKKCFANVTKVDKSVSNSIEITTDLPYNSTLFNTPRTYKTSEDSETFTLGWALKVTFDFQTVVTAHIEPTTTQDGYCIVHTELGEPYDTGDELDSVKLQKFIESASVGKKLYFTRGIYKSAFEKEFIEFDNNMPNNMAVNRLMLPGFPDTSLSAFWNTMTDEEKKYVNPTGSNIIFSEDKYRPYLDSPEKENAGLRQYSMYFDNDDKKNGIIEIYPTIEEMVVSGERIDEISVGSSINDDGVFDDGQEVKDFYIKLKKQIDFDLNDVKNDDFSISLKDGMCGGRTFKINACTKESDGSWSLKCARVKDDALELWFPYKDYPIRKGDHFVLTGLELPDSYIRAASIKLLKYSISYLNSNCKTRYAFQLKVDDLFMARQHDLSVSDSSGATNSLYKTLRAGDVMSIRDEDLGIDSDIVIEQITIKEEEGNIPSYEITLRDDKSVGAITKIQDKIDSIYSAVGAGGTLNESQVESVVAKVAGKLFVTNDWFGRIFNIVDQYGNKQGENEGIAENSSIRAKMSLWSDGGISALGNSASSGGSGGGGLDAELLWSILGNSGTEQISKSHLSDALAGYATEEWVESKGYLTNRDAYTKEEIDAKEWSSNKGTVTSVGITMPTGFSVSGSPITEKGILAIGFATGYSLPTTAKQSNWDTVYNWYSGITGSDTDTIINKWGEIISFLDGIEDTATLSGIVNGINQSITAESNRAQGAEQTLTSSISTNTSAINVLKGYFTNGVAKSAVNASFLSRNDLNSSDNLNEAGSGLYCSYNGDDPSGTYTTNCVTLSLTNYRNDKLQITASLMNAGDHVFVRLAQRVGDATYERWTSWNALAYITDNVASATKLQTARTIWGQSFDGTQDVNGDLILPNGKKIVIGTASLSWDADNNAVKIDGSVYATGGLSALGNSDVAGGGGSGLMGSIVPYAKAISLTTQNEGEEIASAWSVKMLYDKIENVDVSGQLTSYLTKQEAQSMYQPVGNYLTEHQSLDGYVNGIAVEGTGNAVTTVAKSGKTVIFTKGANYLTGITKAQVEGVLTGNITSHTHSQYLTNLDISGKADRSELLGYLPLSGGTMTGGITFNYGDHNSDQFIRFIASDNITYSFGIRRPASVYGLYFVNNGSYYKVWHQGNDGADSGLDADKLDGQHGSYYAAASSLANYLQLSGGTLTNNSTDVVLSIASNNTTAWIGWKLSDSTFRYIGVDTSNNLKFQYNSVSYNVIHSGNIGSQSVNYATSAGYADSAAQVTNSLSWSGYSSGSYNGSTVQSISIPNNTNQLVNGAGYITSSASITGNAATATKLQTARTIWGQSFDGSNDIIGNIYINEYNKSGNTGGAYIIFNKGDNYFGIGADTSNVAVTTLGTCSLDKSWITKSIYLPDNGNVGIGTTSPSYKLDVTGGVRANGFFASYGEVMSSFAIGSGTYNRMAWTLTPNHFEFEFPNATDSYSGSHFPIYFGWRGGIYPLAIAANTNVGIGTTTPTHKLHVVGDMATTGRAIVDSLQIGNITISYDAANKGLRIAGGGLYTDSYLSSLGVDASTALSVKKWSDSINLTEESDSELATAYSIGNLYRLINSNQESITQSLNQSVGALQGRCTSLEQRVSALENKVN